MPSKRKRAKQKQKSAIEMVVENVRSLATVSSENEIDFNVRKDAEFVSTFNESDRSIEIILATETPTMVFDAEKRTVVDEVLLADGMQAVDEIPLLDNHNRFDNDAVFGLIKSIRATNGEIRARIYFADMQRFLEKHPSDEAALKLERTVEKVRQGVLKGISAGYRINERTYIPAGQSRTVAGKKYTARANVGMSIVTNWIPREGSITPVQADRFSKTRSERNGANEMPVKLRKKLQELGLRADATEAEAWSHYHGLNESQRSELSDLTDGVTIPEQQSESGERAASDVASETAAEIADAVRAALNGETTDENAASEASSVSDAVRAAIDAERSQERQRVANINNLFGDSEPELRNRAIAEGWDYQRASSELVPRLRQLYRAPLSGDVGGSAASSNLAIHSRGADDVNEEVISAALMLRSGVNVEHRFFEDRDLTDNRITARSLCGSINSDDRQRTLERANNIRRMSIVDMCSTIMRLRGINDFDPHDAESIVHRALSSGTVTNIFTSDVSARLMTSYLDAADTTLGWTMEEEVSNFKTNERIGMGKFEGLKKHARGGTAEDDYMTDEKEEYKIARYSDKYVIDEQDMIDDDINGLNSITPSDMGMAAAQLRPDLVYALLHANANMRDGTALFHADHGNLRSGGSTALSIASLETGEVAFGKQRIGTRPLNLRARYLIVPRELKWKAAQIMASAERRESAAADGIANPISGEDISIRYDDRMGAVGVVDPDTGTTQTGTATNWLMTASPGESGARTVVVGYRRGTGRAPTVRSFVLTQGQWGIGYDIKHDIGVKALDWRAMQWNAGA